KKSMYEEAIRETEKARVLADNPANELLENVSYRGYVYAVSGRRDEAQKILKDLIELRKPRHVFACKIALVYAGLGETDHAFAWFETAYKERELWFSWLNDPILDSLRSDPRFADLQRRVAIQQ